VSVPAGERRSRAGILGALREVIAALDRRRPQQHRPGEATVARESASLRSEASDRVDAMERDAGGVAAGGRPGSSPVRS
jgi:hypothetical protein